MSDATSPLWLWLILIFIIFSRVSSADQTNITAESGQNITLTCRAPNYIISGVEWSRADLEPEYVLFYRDGHFVTDDYHPSFVNRVDLQDRQMKDGDVSLILKDVTINDTGTYECGVVQSGTHHLTPIRIIYLRVVAPPGQPGGATEGGGKEGGYVGLIVGLSVLAVLLLLVAVLISKRCRKQHGLDPKQPPDEQQQTCKEKLLIKVVP